jgi:hypothetical protein
LYVMPTTSKFGKNILISKGENRKATRISQHLLKYI